MLLKMIEKERDGEIVERSYIMKCVQMLIEVGLQNIKIYQ
jgi:hypothetical protein